MTRAATRNVIRAAALGLLLALGVPARAQDVPPDQLVKTVTLEVIDLIKGDKEIQAGNRAKLVQLIDAKVLPHFNFSAMTALAMGHSWNKANPEQKKRLTEEFRTLLVRTYASALAAYAEQKFDFRPLRAKPTDTDVTVQVRRPAGADRLQHGEDGGRLEGVRRDGRRREPRRQLPHRVQQRGARIRHRRPDQEPRDEEQVARGRGLGEEMIRREGPRLVVSGAVTLGNAAALLEEGRRHIAEGVQTVDLAEVNEMDSALLAVLLAWLRDARSREKKISFVNLPESLRTIAQLYGVDRLLPTT